MLLSLSKPCLLQLIFTTLLLTQLNKVKSTDASARSYTLTSFSFPDFRSYDLKTGTEITFLGSASHNAEALQLTSTDKNGAPMKQDAGQASYSQNVFLWDSSGHAASFYTSFTFQVKNYYNDAKKITADGFAFFLAPPESSIKEYRGRLGLFNYATATDTSMNQVVAVEFDTWPNSEWKDPSYPHIGIDVNSIESVATKRWDDSDAYGSKVGTAHIAYDATSKTLTVVLTHDNGGLYVLSHVVDLANILPEWARIGFSGSSGYGETQYILSWNFTSTLESSKIRAMTHNLRSFAS